MITPSLLLRTARRLCKAVRAVGSGRCSRPAAIGVLACGLALATTTVRATEDDWLPESEADVAPAANAQDGRVFAEVALDRAWDGHGNTLDTLANAALDAYLTATPADSWQAVLSARLDYDHAESATAPSSHTHALTLREAYVSHAAASSTVDVGRITVRDGVATGFNPSDVFRAGSLLARRTNDPTRLRESRVGVVGARIQHTFAAGELAAMLVPSIDDDQQPGWYSPRWGSVNDGRAQAYLKYTPPRWGNLYTSVIWHHARDAGNTWGFNASSTLGTSTIAYLEYARTALVPMSAVLAGSEDQNRRGTTQFAAGISVSTATRLTATLEYDFNDAGLDRAHWNGAWGTASPERVSHALGEAALRQDPLGRHSALLMIQREQAFSPNDQLACLVRANLVDRSQLRWCEWRYRLPRVEWSANVASVDGAARSEYGAGPAAWALGVKARFYFF